MVKRFLVTTALEETWPAVDVPVLFLGEWCRLYDRKSNWGNRDAVVAPYHWNDREKLFEDYQYIQKLYEEILEELATKLNQIHEVHHSIRYWRIIVGPWLGYFIQMLFDRWAMLHQAVSENDISGVRVLSGKTESLIPNDMEDFVNLFLGDKWNELIYGQLLARMGVSIEKIAIDGGVLSTGQQTVELGFRRKLKRAIAKMLSQLSGLIGRDSEYFFISSYLPIKQDLLLQLRLGQIPKFWRQIKPPTIPVNPDMRQWQLSEWMGEDDFVAVTRSMISSHIPTVYLEGYGEILALCKKLPWTKHPKAIFTSNSYSSDDVFKVWAAEQIDRGVPLVVGQHGGNYGMARWSFTEEHQIAISDRFITWGWGQNDSAKISSIGNLKGFGKRVDWDENGDALLVEMIIPRTSYWMFSVPVASQWLDYFEEQIRFVQALPEELRQKVLVRLCAQDWGWQQKRRWQEFFPFIRLDEGFRSMELLMAKSRLFISSYNATTYLESMSINMPTIIFWNPKQWELRDSAAPFFEKLKTVGIFHDTPESAAHQMAAVWSDVSGWWQSESVQAVRREFCERYTHIPDNPLEIMSDLFLDVQCKNDKASKSDLA